MANIVYLTCRTLGGSPCANGKFHVAEVGWMRDDGQSGRADLQGMVTWLTEADNEAYTRAPNGQQAQVHVLWCSAHQYIETYPDSSKADNLRELPRC